MISIFKKSKVVQVILICIILCLGITGVVAYSDNRANKSTITITTSSNEVNVGEEFTVTYEIKPKDLDKLSGGNGTLILKQSIGTNVKLGENNPIIIMQDNNTLEYTNRSDKNNIDIEIAYNYFNMGGYYKTKPIKISIMYQAINSGQYELKGGKITLRARHGNDNQEENISIENKNINITTDNKEKFDVNINILDSFSIINLIDQYDSSDMTQGNNGRYDKDVYNTYVNDEYKLYGNAIAKFQLDSYKVKFFEYQFIEANNGELITGITTSNESWTTINKENKNSMSYKEIVNFPREEGRYFIAYRCGKNSNHEMTGYYGPFNISEKISVDRSLELVDVSEELNIGQDYKITYEINPQPIDVRDIYKNEEYLPVETVKITEYEISDIIPKELGIRGASENVELIKENVQNHDKNKVTMKLNMPIEYKLDDDKKAFIYKGDPIKVKLHIKPTISGEYKLLGEFCEYSYNDLEKKDLQGSQQEPTIRINGRLLSDLTIKVSGSEILDHGIYLNNGEVVLMNNSSGEIQVAPEIPVNIGILVDTNGDAIIELGKNGEAHLVDLKKVKIYKIDDENNSVSLSQQWITDLTKVPNELAMNSTIDLSTLDNGKYIVIYNVTPNNKGNIKLEASVVGTNSSKSLDLKLENEDLPNLF